MDKNIIKETMLSLEGDASKAPAKSTSITLGSTEANRSPGHDLRCLARFFAVLVHQMRAVIGGATLAAPVMQAATALIADTATEHGLDFSAE